MSDPARWAHTFILRIRFEPREIPGAHAPWRGTIQHLPSQATTSVKTLEEVVAVIDQYLRKSGP